MNEDIIHGLSVVGRLIVVNLIMTVAQLEKAGIPLENELAESSEAAKLMRESVWRTQGFTQQLLDLPAGDFWDRVQSGGLYKSVQDFL